MSIVLKERPEALKQILERRKNVNKELLKKGEIVLSPQSTKRLIKRLRRQDEFRASSLSRASK